MESEIAHSTVSAALAARGSLVAAARTGGVDEPRMAAIARAAIFEEALLGALRSRFNELRTVAK
jgi:hypothetical protein